MSKDLEEIEKLLAHATEILRVLKRLQRLKDRDVKREKRNAV